ncbi:adenosylcobinamide amidohydrolase [Lentibacillus sp. N15]|uniref:adenosylcobinamide amidohydrolase n=1 Tax=Lentibacillus songyuanensis TaxID=3136161 RepID=UPI0031BB8FFA
MIHVHNVSGGYANKTIVHDVTFQVKEGEFFGIIGPNGSGKTTLLNMVSGILPVQQGEITLSGRLVTDFSAKDFARQVAVLPQHTSQTFSYTVKETVTLGRYAHQKGLFSSLAKKDEHVVHDVMQKTGVNAYQDALLDQLSGGERQRVYLAQALAQQPKVLLLDEPTNHLDLAFQKELLDLLKQWTVNKELTVVSIFHDLNLASIYCDRLLLLHQGRTKICDRPDDVLKAATVEEVYQTKVEKHPHPKIPKPQIMLVPEKLETQKPFPIIDDRLLHINEEGLYLQSPYPLKTMSSGVTGSGTGWYQTFVNRHVDRNLRCDDYQQEMMGYLASRGFDPNKTVGMKTAASPTDVAYQFVSSDDCSVFIVVTAGSGNAVDTAHVGNHEFHSNQPFVTINTWVFVNGNLTDTAFIQCMMLATEAKVKALHEIAVMDNVTGTSADSILIAGTQHGPTLTYGGSITSLGSLVGKGVYTCMKQALHHHLNEKKSNTRSTN